MDFSWQDCFLSCKSQHCSTEIECSPSIFPLNTNEWTILNSFYLRSGSLISLIILLLCLYEKKIILCSFVIPIWKTLSNNDIAFCGSILRHIKRCHICINTVMLLWLLFMPFGIPHGQELEFFMSMSWSAFRLTFRTVCVDKTRLMGPSCSRPCLSLMTSRSELASFQDSRCVCSWGRQANEGSASVDFASFLASQAHCLWVEPFSVACPKADLVLCRC